MKYSNTWLLFILSCAISSCAILGGQSPENIKKNNTFEVFCNVEGAKIEVLNNPGKLQFQPTNENRGALGYYSSNTFEKLRKGDTKLIVFKENYVPDTIKIKRAARPGVLIFDICLLTPYSPLLDMLSPDFYRISKKSRIHHIELQFTENYLKQEFEKVRNTKFESDIDRYITSYPNSKFIDELTQRKDSIVTIRNRFNQEKTSIILSSDVNQMIQFKEVALSSKEYKQYLSDDIIQTTLAEFSATISDNLKEKVISEIAVIVKKGDVSSLISFNKDLLLNQKFQKHVFLEAKDKIKQDVENDIDKLLKSTLQLEVLNIKKRGNIDDFLGCNRKMYTEELYLGNLKESSRKSISNEISKELDNVLISNLKLTGGLEKKIEEYKFFWLRIQKFESENPNISLPICRNTKGEVCDLLLTKMSDISNKSEQEIFLNQISLDFGAGFAENNKNLPFFLMEKCKNYSGIVTTYGFTIGSLECSPEFQEKVKNFYSSQRLFGQSESLQNIVLNTEKEIITINSGKIVAIDGFKNEKKAYTLKRFYQEKSKKEKLDYRDLSVLCIQFFESLDSSSTNFGGLSKVLFYNISKQLVVFNCSSSINKTYADWKSEIADYENRLNASQKSQGGVYFEKVELESMWSRVWELRSKLDNFYFPLLTNLDGSTSSSAKGAYWEFLNGIIPEVADINNFRNSLEPFPGKITARLEELSLQIANKEERERKEESKKQELYNSNNSGGNSIDIRDAFLVENYILGKVWSNNNIGTYGLVFSYDYSSITHNNCMIFWNSQTSKNDPAGVFINVEFRPQRGRCEIGGMDIKGGPNMFIYLYPDGHIETQDRNRMELQ